MQIDKQIFANKHSP